jgi:coenzyme A diphosphatase NUDT7
VLVLLHVNPGGELSVTLTTRSLRMRSHPGETALPGGRYEEGDEEVEWTAVSAGFALFFWRFDLVMDMDLFGN